MSVNPMVEQVNRLILSLLVSGGEVFLPTVGSLYVEHRAARRLTKNTIAPPCRAVSFSSQQRGVSLVDAIARAGQCDQAQAQDIYDRWLARTVENDVLSLEGIGVLKFKNFTLDAAFDAQLNPQGHAPVKLKSTRRFDWVLWLGVTAILFVAAGGAAIWATDGNLLAWWPAESQVAISIPAPSVSQVESTPALPSDTLVVAEVVAESTTTLPAEPSQPAPKATSATPEAPAELVSGRCYVVLGVFSSAENAARAIRDAQGKESSLICSVYRFGGGKLLVSPFESPDAEACRGFARGVSATFPDLWVHNAR